MADRWAARTAVWPQYLLPKQALTAFGGWVATRRWGSATTRLIAWFVNKYQVDMAEAAQPEIAAYHHFNDFFTRALRSDARPLASARWLCPVDGAISQFGAIENGHIFQAKGHRYSATALVGGDSALAAQFTHGSFATLYLSPRDYHRIHMPCAGTLRHMIYVPGDLFSVNPTTARGVPGLFARNERVVCVFDTAHGPLVMVLVGATIVGSMATVWHGVVNPPRTGRISRHDYPPDAVQLEQGEEMGRFLLGSTVVLLLAEAAPGWNPAWQPGDLIRMGQPMAGVG